MNRARLGSVLFAGGLVVLLAAPSSEGEALAGPGDAKVAADVDGPSRTDGNVAAGAAAAAKAGASALANAGLKPAATPDLSTTGGCAEGMVEVEGDYCPEVEQNCL